MTTIVLFAKRVVVVNGDTDECQNLLDQALTRGNTYIYIGVKVSSEVYSSADVRRVCHLFTKEEISEAGMKTSDIVYSSQFGTKTDPILAKASVRLVLAQSFIDQVNAALIEARRIGAGGLVQANEELLGGKPVRQCTLYYNKNETSARNITNLLTHRVIPITLDNKVWRVSRAKAEQESIIQHTPPSIIAATPAPADPLPGPARTGRPT